MIIRLFIANNTLNKQLKRFSLLKVIYSKVFNLKTFKSVAIVFFKLFLKASINKSNVLYF